MGGHPQNQRGWADWVCTAHDPDYRAAKKDFETFVETLTPKLAEKDATVPELPAKDLVRTLAPIFDRH